MKKFLFPLLISLVASFHISSAVADAAYPYTNAVFTPSAISPVASVSAPTTYAISLQNRSILGVEINGTCTSLAATIQVSVDGTTWRTVNVYPVTTGAISAAASISATGAYRANVSGAKNARVNVTALAAACNISAVATEGGIAPNL